MEQTNGCQPRERIGFRFNQDNMRLSERTGMGAADVSAAANALEI